MNRAHWRALANERALEAQALIQAARWSGAFHLAGYAVECGLKACVLAYIENGNSDVIFRKKKFSESCWTHNIAELVQLADLEAIRDGDVAVSPALGVNWSVVTQWKETSRYDLKLEFDARRLATAVTDAGNGVLPWVRIRW